MRPGDQRRYPGLQARLPALDQSRTLVMGIVNVTPDSFSDGGCWARPEQAIAHGQDLLAAGADLLDVGGESTRPGAVRVSAAEELDRVLPVVEALAGEAVISIDTMRAEVARQALAAGAQIVNDVSGGLADPDMLAVVAETGAPYICMYATGPSAAGDTANLARELELDDPTGQVVAGLQRRLVDLQASGVAADQVILDPGLGFAFAGQPNWQLLGGLDRLLALGYPVLIGASRKRFLATAVPEPTAPDAATAAVSALAALAGAWAVRVHDAASSYAAVRVAERWRAGWTANEGYRRREECA